MEQFTSRVRRIADRNNELNIALGELQLAHETIDVLEGTIEHLYTRVFELEEARDAAHERATVAEKRLAEIESPPDVV